MSAMEVILLERVEKLGQMGDVVRVKPGFARNFLLPQKKALRATKENRERFEKQRAQLEAVNLKQRQEAQVIAKKMEGLSVVLVRQAGETGQLYGSVTARDIADAVIAAGFTITHRQVRIDRPIKTLGLVQTRVMLHPEVDVAVTVNVAKSEEEAERQAAGETVAAEEFFETPAAPAEAPAAEGERKPPPAEGGAKRKKTRAKKEKAEAGAEEGEANPKGPRAKGRPKAGNRGGDGA